MAADFGEKNGCWTMRRKSSGVYRPSSKTWRTHFYDMENWIVRVTGIRPEATGMKTIFLERRNGEPFLYDAGQFLTLLFSFRGHELRRSYSFSTTPGVDAVPAITVKRVPNGEISRHLLDHLRVGDILTTLPPAGRFTFS